MEFKRNQVEEAIALAFGQTEPTTELRSKTKRLLDLDRSWIPNHGASDPVKACYAFFSDGPPGKGAEVWFSSYDVLAVFLGLNMLRSGWPQAHVVRALRQVREELKRHYAAISKRSPEQISDLKKIKAAPRAGDFAFVSSDPVLLTICSAKKRDDNKAVNAGICLSQDDCFRFWNAAGRTAGASMSVLDVTAAAAQILRLLLKTEPRSRGRTS